MRSTKCGSSEALPPVGPAAIANLAGLDAAVLSVAETLNALGRLESAAGWLASLQVPLLRRLSELTPEPEPSAAGRGKISDDSEHREHCWEREELMVACRVGGFEAGRRLRVAAALFESLPGTRVALAAGAVSWAHATALTEEVRGLVPAHAGRVEAAVLSDRRAVTATQFRARARKLAAGLRPDLAVASAQDVYDSRRLVVWSTGPGAASLSGDFTVEDLATITAAVDDLAGRLGPGDERTADARTRSSTCARSTSRAGPGRARLSGACQMVCVSGRSSFEGTMTDVYVDGCERRPRAVRA